MPRINISFNGTAVDLDDFCYAHNYLDNVFNDEGEEVSNPESKVQYFERKIKEFVFDSVKARRIKKATDTARTTEQGKEISF